MPLAAPVPMLCFLSRDSERIAAVQGILYLLGVRFQTRLWRGDRPLQLPIADIFVLDALPDVSETISLAGEVMAGSDQRPVLIATDEITEGLAFAALSSDVRGLVAYSDLQQQLAAAVQVVVAGGFWIPRSFLVRFLESSLAVARRTRFALARAELSENELVLLDAVLSRYSDEQISARLHLPAEDIASTVNRLLQTFGVRRRDDLVLLADQRSITVSVE
ncbi:MAG: hypothetical protein AB7O65_02660 [Candidatus Korobacteraceae bacterium]